ncbi:hypothetical protein IH980_02645 [Patescibacteria group bacterium]|nr:hypothetical protein [Patescibacteria group bacterium]
MKKVVISLISLLLLASSVLLFPRIAHAAPDRCEAINISPSGLTICAGEFGSENDCLAHILEVRTPGPSAECEQTFPFDTCAEDANGWFTCVTASGPASGCEDRNLDYRARRGFLGTTWCKLTINLTGDEGETIGIGGGGAGDYFKPTECPCPKGFTGEFCADNPAIETALGCIPTHPLYFVGSIRDLLIGVGGGIALLLMIIGAFFVLTSQGQPERVQRGKEIFVGALVGLLIMIFAVFLLQLIGVDILGLFI